MENSKNNHMRRFLILGLVGLMVFSMVIFGTLGVYTSRVSKRAFYRIGELYMAGMTEQLSSHFETAINQRFTMLASIVALVSPDNEDREALYEELAYNAQIRGFDYVALCSAEGDFETLYGLSIQPTNPEPLIASLTGGVQRVSIGTNQEGEQVVLFSVNAEYPMPNGKQSIGLVVATPVEYIADFLELDQHDELMYCHIIRRNGSFVVQNPNIEMVGYFEILHAQLTDTGANLPVEPSIREFGEALRDGKAYSTIFKVNGEERQIYSMPLPYSEWFVVAIMPYNALNSILMELGGERIGVTVLSCLSILVFIMLIFARYLSINRVQMRELEKARQEAIEASKAKSEFLANMSHDIRTPMNAIVGMTAIATAHLDDREQAKDCLKKITLSSKHLLGLINDILDMSKIESGKLTLNTEQVSLKEVMEGLVSVIQPQVKAKKQSFDIHVENIITEHVWCDGVRLNQVLLNLLSNATKYTQEGGTIQLFFAEEESPKGDDYVRARIKVKDNGMGMSPEFLTKIFESYSRADEARVEKTEGTGLGMAITKYIIDAMEGTIEVQSELNSGTEFNLMLDFEKSAAKEEDMVLPSWHMLVVDDDESLCKSTMQDLDAIGLNAEWTLSGEKALELALKRHEEQDDYQIFLLDWKLPGMNGIETAKELRRNLGGDVIILLISAYDWGELETDARSAGINGFISKPLFRSTLYYGLRKYMCGEEEQQQTMKPEDDLSGYRILLAEDNELNWEIANELLSELGAELDWAEDGQICLDMFRESTVGYYDVILMDIRMPNMNGHEATRAIRELDRSDASTIPIIAMSADAFAEDIQRSKECGMNYHITKPINVTDVARLLRKYVK